MLIFLKISIAILYLWSTQSLRINFKSTHSFLNKFHSIQRSSLVLHVKGKKKTNSKRSFDIEEEDAEEIDADNLADDESFALKLNESLDRIRNLDVPLAPEELNTPKKPSKSKKTNERSKDNEDVNGECLIQANQRNTIESIIRTTIDAMNYKILKLNFVSNRIEITVSNGAYDTEGMKELDAEELRQIHRNLYTEFELRETELAVVTRFEILIATPGVSDVLRFNRDFISFQGFKVMVTTSEEFNKKTSFEGSLVGRTDEYVVLSLKGRKLNIPRNIVIEVKLPKAKIEPDDNEIKKLQ